MPITDLLLDRVEQTMTERGLAGADSQVLLMVSGGSDSTALAYIGQKLLEEKLIGSLAMLHVNHKLRGDAAEDDQEFVSDLADLLGIPLYICEIDVASEARRSGANIEAVARRERYLAANEALESLCMNMAAPLADGRIFTAHTQDDRVENFYMRSIVGTGPGGLRSMLYANGPVVRPVMDLSREDLREYIQQREQDGEVVARDPEGKLWREDATNAHTDRFRAYVRHEIVPRAKERNPQLLDTLCRTMNLIADEDDMLDTRTEKITESWVAWIEEDEAMSGDYSAGCVLAPEFGREPLPMQRRAVMQVLERMLGIDARIETSSVEAVVSGFVGGKPVSGYTNNIQGDLAISANKQGVRIEPMAAYRARRKRE